MSQDDTTAATTTDTTTAATATPPPLLHRTSIFDIPAPLRALFDHFPLRTYAANALPLRAPTQREKHVLLVFTSEEDAVNGRPSFNPGCLKWQTYLRFTGVEFTVQASSNHASPTGILPFLLPGNGGAPVPGKRLRKWLAAQKLAEKVGQEPEDMRYQAYASLLDHRIRKAWLLQLYLLLANRPLVHRLYVAPCSTHPLVQLAVARQLRAAAAAELVKAGGSNTLSATDVFRDAGDAFEALSALLGERDEWFFGAPWPGVFDAAVFAYVHLVLDESLGWGENALREGLVKCGNLVRLRERVLASFYPEAGREKMA